MKRFLLFSIAIITFLGPIRAQSCYWVALTDKAGTSFDPYSYFDSKAIERYRLNNADLYDITNYPLNESYVSQINAVATEEVGQSRWLNAVAVIATDEQIAAIRQMSFVKEIVPIEGHMQVADWKKTEAAEVAAAAPEDEVITDQLMRMQGYLFVNNGIDGKGIRIAVFDGGFHAVNTHQAFKHLRDNNQIIATWNFTNKTADVYDNHSHGTMVLSCIAGRLNGRRLGLATGATFLLAKTEVDPEPFKEEVWWAQAVEWADKNGADIINSSLGYTKDRHYTWEMDGRSYVSKAANLAARKGILVCNSAGNSGEDENWKIIGTPADADSILSVGGIQPSLRTYQHISFSSYGPTADGRLKPNVCNYGYAEVADTHADTATTYAAGTSFSSPLTTGFCACAMQAVRNEKPTVMEMKSLIEQSADLYPYYDYAFGYGVPQASFFTDWDKRNVEQAATFEFKDMSRYVLIRPFKQQPERFKRSMVGVGNSTNGAALQNTSTQENVVMFKIQNRNGLVDQYVNLGFEKLTDNTCIAIPKGALYGQTLVAYVNGFTDSYKLSKLDSIYFADEDHTFDYHVIDTAGYYQEDFNVNGNRSLADNKVSNWGVGQKYLLEWHMQFGIGASLWSKDNNIDGDFSFRTGFRFIRSFKKWYGLGLGLDWGYQEFFYDAATLNMWDNSIALTQNNNVEDKWFDLCLVNLELFQRVRLVTGGKSNKGLHWDIGVYGGLQYNNYTMVYNANQTPNTNGQTNVYYQVLPAAATIWNWGLTTRLVWSRIGLYGRYRMSQPSLNLPRLEIGIQYSL